jgi:rhodanese-related sulfurtransferase
MPRLRQPKRHFTTTLTSLKDDSAQSQSSAASNSTPPKQSTLYTFSDVATLTSQPDPHRILIDVREPSELQSTGRIPTAHNVPVSSAGDGFFLPADEFEDRYGFAKPEEDDEVIFYCKAGVRSRAAARLAIQGGFGGKVAEFPGSWVEWVENGGEVER